MHKNSHMLNILFHYNTGQVKLPKIEHFRGGRGLYIARHLGTNTVYRYDVKTKAQERIVCYAGAPGVAGANFRGAITNWRKFTQDLLFYFAAAKTEHVGNTYIVCWLLVNVVCYWIQRRLGEYKSWGFCIYLLKRNRRQFCNNSRIHTVIPNFPSQKSEICKIGEVSSPQKPPIFHICEILSI